MQHTIEATFIDCDADFRVHVDGECVGRIWRIPRPTDPDAFRATEDAVKRHGGRWFARAFDASISIDGFASREDAIAAVLGRC